MKHMAGLILACVVWTAAGTAQAGSADVLSLFARAAGDYRSGQYDQAIAKYDEILKQGRVSGAVYYNLGNCYFKKNDLGRAIVYYERARRLIPRDGDLESNLKFAQSQAKADSPPAAFWRRIIPFDRVTADELALISFAWLVAAGLCHLAGLFGRWPVARKIGATGLCLACLLLTLKLWTVKVREWERQAVVIKAADATFEPDKQSTIHFHLSEGTTIEVQKESAGWLKIRRFDNQEGWVPQDDVEKI